MLSASSGPSPSGLAKVLLLEGFYALEAELSAWRLDPELIRTGQWGTVHPFIRGLRVSARLVYIIRQAVSGTGAEAHWGQILSTDGRTCSRECDVIIHQPGERQKWNGHDRSVMDFRFINQERAIAVVSCKSFLQSISKEDRQYCQDMKGFVKRVYLFAECCLHRRLRALEQQALEAGYDGFWHLYAFPSKAAVGLTKKDEEVWLDFVAEMQRIAGKPQ